jgi:hypothetical protein
MGGVTCAIYAIMSLYRQGSGDFSAQPAKIRPFTTSTGFSRI